MNEDETLDTDEGYEYDDDGYDERDYAYDDDRDGDEDGEFPHSSKGSKFANKPSGISAPALMRENSSGGYYLQIPCDTYMIQPGDEQSILPLLQGLLTEVSNVCGVSMDEALALLRLMAYNKERTIERYMDQPEKFRLDAFIDLYNEDSISSQLLAIPTITSDSIESTNSYGIDANPLCEICYDTVNSAAQGFKLGCNHLYCRDCYSGHIQAKINDGPVCIGMSCPALKCRQWIPYEAVKSLLASSRPDLVVRYEQFLVSNFIEKTQFFRYCPGQNCGRVAIGSGVSSIHCHCGLDFCFHCGEEAHNPCSCEQLHKWNAKGKDENENLLWIQANTQRCPNVKCNYPIEKNEGCNHMTCSQCRYEFCWICLGDWKRHGGSFYECNKFKVAAEEDTERSKARKESDRYLHYFRRYQIHQDHGKHAKTLLTKYIENYETFLCNNPSIPMIDSDRFLITACEQLVEFRRVLKNTYIMGFYLKDASSDKLLFEHQQALLEEGTDLLQELVKSSSAIRRKEEIIRRTQVVNGFFKRLTSSFAGGVVHSFDLTG